MTTKQSGVGLNRGIYESPFDAFTNYMNILGDFINRVNSRYPEEIDNDELNGLLTTIHNQGKEIEMKEKEMEILLAKSEKLELEVDKLRAKLDEKSIASTSATSRKKTTVSKSKTSK